MIDGEVVALDESGRPSFNALQNGSATAQLCYYVFDVLVLAGRHVMAEPLSARRQLHQTGARPIGCVRRDVSARLPTSGKAIGDDQLI